MAQLLALDKQLHGSCSMPSAPLRRGKPRARACPLCQQQVGVSEASLALHMKTKHGGQQAPAAEQAAGGGA
jgi:hypothetical protein